MKTPLWLALATSLLLAPAAHAGLRRTTGTLVMTESSFTGGVCDQFNYSATCPSGNCACRFYTGSVRGPLIGKGTATMEVTVDIGARATYDPSGPVISSCAPIFAVISIEASRDSEDIDANGSMCDGFNNRTPVLGGWSILDSSAGVAAWGTYTGALINRTLTIHFQGEAVTGP